MLIGFYFFHYEMFLAKTPGYETSVYDINSSTLWLLVCLKPVSLEKSCYSFLILHVTRIWWWVRMKGFLLHYESSIPNQLSTMITKWSRLKPDYGILWRDDPWYQRRVGIILNSFSTIFNKFLLACEHSCVDNKIVWSK